MCHVPASQVPIIARMSRQPHAVAATAAHRLQRMLHVQKWAWPRQLTVHIQHPHIAATDIALHCQQLTQVAYPITRLPNVPILLLLIVVAAQYVALRLRRRQHVDVTSLTLAPILSKQSAVQKRKMYTFSEHQPAVHQCSTFTLRALKTGIPITFALIPGKLIAAAKTLKHLPVVPTVQLQPGPQPDQLRDTQVQPEVHQEILVEGHK
jgi:hypothetical protein